VLRLPLVPLSEPSSSAVQAALVAAGVEDI